MLQQPLNVTITSLSNQGEGVTHVHGKTILVPYALPQEEVVVRVTGEKKDTIRAEIIEMIHPSSDRVEPPCPHFTRCGGCSLQHLSPDYYRVFKIALLDEALCGESVECKRLLPLLEVGEAARRRVVWQVDTRTRPIKLGYHRAKSHQVIDVTRCVIIEPCLEALIAPLRQTLSRLPSVQLIETITAVSLELGCALTLHCTGPLPLDAIEILTEFSKKTGVARLDMQLGKQSPEIIASFKKTELHVGDITLQVPSLTFQQATKKGQLAILQVIEQALQECNTIADIYSGCGFVSFALVNQGKKIEAYEGSNAMVEAMQRTTKQYQLQHKIQAFRRDLTHQPLSPKELMRFDGVIINPPRSGAMAQAKELADSMVKTIVMISCNPETFANDAHILIQGGYSLESILPIDQFTYSPHLELAAVFKR